MSVLLTCMTDTGKTPYRHARYLALDELIERTVDLANAWHGTVGALTWDVRELAKRAKRIHREREIAWAEVAKLRAEFGHRQHANKAEPMPFDVDDSDEPLATCRHCLQAITRLVLHLFGGGSERVWTHDDSGSPVCDEAEQALLRDELDAARRDGRA